MNCFICSSTASSPDNFGDYVHIICSRCGEYKISGNAIGLWQAKIIKPAAILKAIEIKRQKNDKIPMFSMLDI